MRKAIVNMAITLFALTGCMGCGNQPASQEENLITVDVMADYPKKELILQDFMDVEYIALESTDEFITKGAVKAIGKDILLVTNRGSDGDILVFDRKGKGIRKINHLGQSGEEYTQLTGLVLDEDNNEMFVKDNPARKILVYDLSGGFKRCFKFVDTNYYDYMFNYDRDHLICYKRYLSSEKNEEECHLIISKRDGSITHEIRIPSKEKETAVVIKGEFVITPEFYLTFPDQDKWVLVNTSSDTVFHYSPDGNLNPFIVRTPSIHSMETKVFLFPTVITDRYCFMRTMKKEVDFKTFKGFPGAGLVYDRQENALFNYTLYNNDFSNKEEVSLTSEPRNQEIAICQTLNAPDLVEAYEKGELKGKLKEIVASLDEESNPVVMLLKYKEF